MAHHLKPILHIGKGGVDEDTSRTVEEAFNSRELFKVKVNDTAPESPRETAAQLAEKIAGLEVVQVIGRTLVLYRRHPDRPAIELP